MNEIVIESGIPIPKTKGRWSKTIEKMKVRDSIKAKSRNEAVAIQQSGRGLGFVMSFRIENDHFRV